MKTIKLTLAVLMLAGLPNGCGKKPTQQEQNKMVLQRMYDEAISGGNLSVIDSLVDPNVINHSTEPSAQQGVGGLKSVIAGLHVCIPDIKMKPDAMYTDGDNVIARSTITGTQSGVYRGYPPTNRPFKVQGLDIVKVANGKIVEYWGLIDNYELLSQLGHISPPHAQDIAKPDTTKH